MMRMKVVNFNKGYPHPISDLRRSARLMKTWVTNILSPNGRSWLHPAIVEHLPQQASRQIYGLVREGQAAQLCSETHRWLCKSWTEAGIIVKQLKLELIRSGRGRGRWLLDNESPVATISVIHAGRRRRGHVVVVCLLNPNWLNGETERENLFGYE